MRVVVLGHKTDTPTQESWRPDCADGLRQIGCDVTTLVTAERQRVTTLRPDLLLWLGGDHKSNTYRDMLPTLRALEDKGCVTVGLHLDLYHGVPHREPKIGHGAWWSCQHVFTPDGAQRDWGAVNHHWFPPAFGTRYLGQAEPVPKYRHQAVFVGSCSARIHGEHRENLLKWCENTYGHGFARYGQRNPVWGYELNRLYASADLVVGDSALGQRYWSDRVVRTCGRGGILAHPRVEGMAEQGFTDEALILYPRGRYDEIRQRRDSMTSKEVRAMREAAVTLISERHTWRHALTRMLKTVGLT